MAVITTFSTLKTAVADWLDRDDISAVGGPIDTMIDLAEQQMYRDLRLRFMESATSATIAAGSIGIPADFIELKQANITVSGAQVALHARPSEWMYARYPKRTGDGEPSYLAQEGDTYIFGPGPDAGYVVNLQYYSRPTSLGTGNETNWLTTNAGDALLNATLLQSVGYLGMDERVPYWQANYDKGMKELKQQQKRQRYAGEQDLRVHPG